MTSVYSIFGKRSKLLEKSSKLYQSNLQNPQPFPTFRTPRSPAEKKQIMSSYSRQSSTASNTSSSSAGTSSFLVGRDRQRQPEMEFFSQDRKPRSNYRRPSSLGLSTNPLPDKSEAKVQYKALPASRSHIVAPLKDHLKPEGAFEKASEVASQYRNLSPSRPVIHKLKDHLKPEGDFSSKSETSTVYKDNHATRPVIHKLRDHSADVQPEGQLAKNSEYRTNFAKTMTGQRAEPAWLSDFEKVTIE